MHLVLGGCKKGGSFGLFARKHRHVKQVTGLLQGGGLSVKLHIDIALDIAAPDVFHDAFWWSL